MKRTLLCTLLLVFSAAFCLASFNPAYSDYQFYNLHDLAADASYLDDSITVAADDEEKAAILWRQARNVLTQTDELSGANKETLLAGYARSEELARQSIDLVSTADGYHWLSSAIGQDRSTDR